MTRDRSGDRPKSAAELMAELTRDPEYVARMKQRELQKASHAEGYARAAKPLLEELATIGFPVKSVAELRQSVKESGGSYRAAVPTLIRWLPLVSDLAVKEDIVRTLSVPWAKPEAARPLIVEFDKADDERGATLRWAIGNGLEVVADDSVFDDLVRLVRDKRFGKAREMIALALGNTTNPQAVVVLIDLLNDRQLVGHAVMALGKLKAREALVPLKGLLQHPTPWVRQEVVKAVAAIERAT